MSKIYKSQRVFNGKIYDWFFTSSVKQGAKEMATKLRKEGCLVRMVKQRIGYMIYARKDAKTN